MTQHRRVGSPSSEFDRIDRNGDGVITREEFHDAHSPPPSPAGAYAWSALWSDIQDSLKPHDRFQSGIVKEHVFLEALQQHGVDPGHPAVARMLGHASGSGHVMYKQFFKDAVAREKLSRPSITPKRTDTAPHRTPSRASPVSEAAALRAEVRRLREALAQAEQHRWADRGGEDAQWQEEVQSLRTSCEWLRRQNVELREQLEQAKEDHAEELERTVLRLVQIQQRQGGGYDCSVRDGF